jgi:hypothetical protein
MDVSSASYRMDGALGIIVLVALVVVAAGFFGTLLLQEWRQRRQMKRGMERSKEDEEH